MTLKEEAMLGISHTVLISYDNKHWKKINNNLYSFYRIYYKILFGKFFVQFEYA